MSRIALKRISMEDYFSSNQDSHTIEVYLTHGEEIKFKLKFKTEKEQNRFLDSLTIKKTSTGKPTFSQEVVGRKVVLKSRAIGDNYATLQIESDSMILYMALKRQYERQMRRKLDTIQEDYEDYDYQTTYIFK